MASRPDKLTVESIDEAAAYAREAYRKALDTAGKGLFSAKAFAELERKMDALERRRQKAAAEAHDMKMKSLNESLSLEERNRAKLEEKMANKRVQAITSEFQAQANNVDKIAKKWDEAGKTFKEHMVASSAAAVETFGEGLQNALEGLKSKDLFGSFGKTLKQGGAGIAKKGEALGGAEKGGIAKLLTQIGPMVAGIGAVVLGFAALVKIVMDADARIKDLNKSILDAGVAGAELGDDVSGSMDRIREAFSGTGALRYLDEFGTTTKENITILGAFAKEGLVYEEITGKTNDQVEATKRLQEATSGVLVYSRLLGESAETVASNMAEMMEETATTLDGVRKKYTDIAKAAKESGFDTKRFYGMVLQMTSGMSMYNVRLSETLGMLTRFGKIMGIKQGTEFAKDLQKGFRDMSSQERIKLGMKIGGKSVKGLAAGEAVDQAGSLLTTLREVQAGGGPGADALSKALENSPALGNLADLTPESLAKAFAAMPKSQVNALMLDLNKASPTLGSKAFEAANAARAAGSGDLNSQIESLGPIATLLAKNMSGRAVLGGKDVDQIDITSKMARMFMENQGMSQEEFRNLQKTMGEARAMFERVKKGENLTEEEKSQYNAGMSFEDVTRKYFGLKDKEAAKTQKEMEEDAKRKDEAWKTDLEYSKSIMESTRSMADRMENVIEQLLTSISEGINDLVTFFFGGQDANTKQAKTKLLTESQDRIGALTKQLAGVKGSDAASREQRKQIQREIEKERKIYKGVARDTKTEGGGEELRRAARLSQLSPEEQAAVEQQKTTAMRQRVRENPFITPWEFDKQKEQANKEIEEKALKEHEERVQKEEEAAARKLEKTEDVRAKMLSTGITSITDTLKDMEAARALVSGSGGKIGQEQASQLAAAYRTGAALSPELRALVNSNPDAVTKSGLRFNDGILSVESGGKRSAIRISDQDMVSIHKPGGGLSRGGGGAVNNYYIYDGGQALATITKAQNAGVIS